MLSQLLRTAAVAFVTAAVVAQVALAQGEPKNERPFTRPVAGRTTQAAVHGTTQVDPAIQGEPKNEPPFTRPATVVFASRTGFDWSSGGIGVAAGLGIAVSGVGAMTLARKSPRSA